ncbi:NAD(P)/FAD-dependent oxidoreductase [Luteolibacter ambystomatis]|uniref:NADH:ubiquinone reductase (non-electrogenic) n=1 Tax=Luteolibacter ambystomatis TaxID=2824561 RepID=A0A975J114_9BACT|nr:NAD(P)/FAD-dependent oxidoreductase [Luteolibacter ambystomatis]QUE52056.1 NAD(P)/FAD-dependent oxidoreductase [Luteolibacter ambystomatis]
MSERNASAKGPRKVLIIGGGFAGLECAQKLANDSRFDVTLVDRNNHHLFQPLLYQVATASLAASDIARSIRQVLTKAKNVTVLMDEITAIDSDAKTANGKSGTVYHYDTLLLAAGARTGYFGRDEWAEHTLGLKTLAEAQTVRRTVLSNLEKAELTSDPAEKKRLMTVVIIGGGPTGVELAGAFADLIHRSLKEDFRRIDTSKLRVLLLEGADRILAVYDKDQSDYTKKRLIKEGVEVMTSTKVVNITKGRAELEDGTVLESEAIIWAAGVAANPLAALLGVPTDRGGRVTPNPDLSLPGKPDIFVAGDLVAILDENGKPVPGVAPAASQMGRHVAKVLKEDARLDTTSFAGDKASLRAKFRYWDKGLMAIIGKNHAVVKAGQMRVKGFIAWLMWLFIHILFLVGFRNKLSVLLGWAFSYIRDNPEARVIVNRPGTVAKEA